MEPNEEVTDSPTGWVAKHVREYVETDGKKGGRKWGMDMLLLTTRGRKSGQLRRTALIYGRDGDRYLVVSSNAGAANHTAWYLNLCADPHLWVQVDADRFAAVARTATAAEKPALWKLMAKIFPTFDRYQAETRREIPVVIIERIPD